MGLLATSVLRTMKFVILKNNNNFIIIFSHPAICSHILLSAYLLLAKKHFYGIFANF